MGPSDLTNLLPYERQRLLMRGYYLRLGVVILVSLSFLAGVAGVLLIPTYIFLRESGSAKESRLENARATLSSSDETKLATHLLALSNNIQTLTDLAKAKSASHLLSTFLAVPRPGITISQFDYSPAAGKKAGTLGISGIATTRDALRQYQLSLQGSSFVRTAELPVSVYAKDANISFRITVTLAP